MKLMVFSDSHGNSELMLRAIGQGEPDMIIHLGDGARDVGRIETQFPRIPLKAVKGNCDFSSNFPGAELFSVGKVRIFITHGHIYGVKWTLSPLIEEATARGADIVMYGHTHTACYSTESGLHVLNPGTCGYPPSPSYAEVTIDDRGEVFCRIIRL